MSGDALVLLIGGVHLIGLVAVGVLMLPALRDNPPSPGGHGDEGGGDGWGRGPRRPPQPPKPPRGGIPLLDAVQSSVRMREPGRLADRLPRRERRPAREPARQPTRTPQRVARLPGR
ncbi:MAG TPA: hypothetical protein VKV27_02750 [Solirubrobacteraceae bacterium]|nr:hypothetical protein [Solirubrobacteraceae bacterium]